MKRRQSARKSTMVQRLIRCGLDPIRNTAFVARMEAMATITAQARQAYDDDVPRDQGEVHFGTDAWKTEFWNAQWDWQKAYREGESTRTNLGSKDENPYHQVKPPFSLRQMELEEAWRMGFENEPI